MWSYQVWFGDPESLFCVTFSLSLWRVLEHQQCLLQLWFIYTRVWAQKWAAGMWSFAVVYSGKVNSETRTNWMDTLCLLLWWSDHHRHWSAVASFRNAQKCLKLHIFQSLNSVFVVISSSLLAFNAFRRFMAFWLHYLPGGCNHSIGNTPLTSRTHHWRRWSAAPLTSRCVRRLQLSPHQRGRRSGPAESTTHREQLGGSEWESRGTLRLNERYWWKRWMFNLQ